MSLTATPRRAARSTRLTAAAIATPLALGVLLTGCSAGQITQTAEKRPAVEGADASIGDLKVANAHFVAPYEGKFVAGDTLEFEFIVTSSGAADEITSIEVDGAAATVNGSLEVPTGGMLVVGENGESTVEATASEELYPATLIPVVISFEDAGELEFEVPVAASLDEIPRDPSQVYEPEEGGHH